MDKRVSNKVIFEEAIAGGLMASASAIAVMAPFTDASTIQNIIHNMYGITELLSMTTVGAAFAAGFALMGWQEPEWVISGMEYFSNPLQGKMVMQANENKLMSDAQLRGEVKGLVIGGVEWARIREVGHCVFNGLPGGGKTVVINSILHQIISRGDRCVIHDPKGDFTSWLYLLSDTVLMGPWDSRSILWDISADILTPEEANSFGMMMATGGADQAGATGGSKYFVDAVREIIAAYICYNIKEFGKNWSWDTFADDIMNGQIIPKALDGNKGLKLLIPNSTGEQVQNVISSLFTAIGWIPAYRASFNIKVNEDGKTIDREGSNMFSIKDWLGGSAHQNIKKVIFNNNKNYDARAKQIFGAMITVMENYVNSPETPEKSADAPNALWFIVDESIQLGASAASSTANIKEMGRSRGVRVIEAMQDASQQTAMMGRDKALATLSVQQTKIYLKTADGTAAEVAKSFGTNTRSRIQFPYAEGVGNKMQVEQVKDVINMAEFTGLKLIKGVGVELIAHNDDILVKLIQPFMDRNITKEIEPQFVKNELFERGIIGANKTQTKDEKLLNEVRSILNADSKVTPPVTPSTEATATPKAEFSESKMDEAISNMIGLPKPILEVADEDITEHSDVDTDSTDTDNQEGNDNVDHS